MFFPPNTLARSLECVANLCPVAPAIKSPYAPLLTFNELLLLIKQTHASLNALGLGRHSRIVSILPNSPLAATAFIAVSASCTFIPLNFAYTADEFESYLNYFEPDAVLTLQGIPSAARDVALKQKIALLECVDESHQGSGFFSLQGKTTLPASLNDYALSDDILMLLCTSGSTGVPKVVPIRQYALCKMVASVNRYRNMQATDSCLNVLPLFHLQGLLVLLYPMLAGGCCVYASPFDVKQFLAWLDIFNPSFYSATPAMHKLILEQALQINSFLKNPALRFITSSSAPLPASEINALESIFQVPLIQTYGMTETLIISDNPLPPKLRKAGSVGVPVDTVITIVNDDNLPLPAGITGEIIVQSPWLMEGYLANQQVDKTPFTANGFRTGDLGFLDNEGYLFVTGRVKEIINRGGQKISPYEVENVLLTHTAVKEAVCFPVPHPALGENCAAVVVLQDNAKIDTETLRLFARQKLSEFKVPYKILISEHLPRGATGKFQRNKLADYFKDALQVTDANKMQTQSVNTDDLTPVYTQLIEIWQAVLNQPTIGIYDNFFELGGHSLLVTALCTEIEQRLKRPVPLDWIFKYPTIEKLTIAL